MPVAPGTSLGPYRVTAKIGEGGMGEVYRARDTTLDRDVALKVLPEGFTSDPDRLARFEREAKVLASLNHPNIGHIYGLEEAEGTKALVLELIDGPTLEDRIKRGPVPIDEALPIAKQIAEALEAAHEQGIIHRDLKPANIKLKPDGTIKVLDFGLAKAVDTAPDGDPNESPTLTAAATQMCVIMGTAAYMSPEQARGRPVDKRTDIWSFGCVLYEMLTGRRAFSGETVSDTLARVLTTNVDVSLLPTELPWPGRRLLHRCFQREPQNRIRDVREALLLVEEERDHASASTRDVTDAPSGGTSGYRPGVWAVGLTMAVSTGLLVWVLKPVPARPVIRTAIPTASLSFDDRDVNLALTPDGTRVVYRGDFEGAPHLFVRALADPDATVLAGLTDPRGPFISPDGNWVGFFSEGGRLLQKVSISGGPAVTICEVPEWGDREFVPRGASWGSDDTIIFATGGADRGGLWRVDATGGSPSTRLTTPDAEQGERDHLWPQLLPGDKAVLFTVALGPQTGTFVALDSQIAVLSLETWTPDGRHVTFASDRAGAFSLYRQLVDGTGAVEPLLLQDGTQWPRSWHPDGSTLAFIQYAPETGSDVWMLSAADGTTTRFLDSPFHETAPVFSPSGQSLAYVSDRSGQTEVYVRSFPGPGPATQLSRGGGLEPRWSVEGDQLFYRRGDEVFRVAFGDESDPVPAEPSLLFHGPGYLLSGDTSDSPNYDTGHNGELLMIDSRGPAETPRRLLLVQNWHQVLLERVSND